MMALFVNTAKTAFLAETMRIRFIQGFNRFSLSQACRAAYSPSSVANLSFTRNSQPRPFDLPCQSPFRPEQAQFGTTVTSGYKPVNASGIPSIVTFSEMLPASPAGRIDGSTL